MKTARVVGGAHQTFDDIGADTLDGGGPTATFTLLNTSVGDLAADDFIFS
ncbi:MAG: hypothetical protein AAGB02_00955 [Pseudomonadota bacterium]